ncbi:Oidioi.mRNA.OKI2018_I69.chr2.g4649.t1.cds [Oikopleura dioica]|uniref:Oidioi.mRNA.OKI2018_I69.chr2.g4649.t1.cds n=1 Tax=Oikopleura dioica TaxID=34765 RepID=A0ABN7T4H3_OIKDI|nr:Oidioi.mRNA.OKI2018_I69.chr2.g4649.t1.cds [Oikopleura dioica]
MNKQRFPHVLSKLTMEPPRAAKTITVFVNGDPHHSGKKFIVNTKRTPTFDSLLGDVTTGVNAPFGAVRNLYTPVGGTRVLDLEALGSGKQYVAGGIKKFKKVEYGRTPRRAKSQDPRSYRHREEKSIPATSRFQNINDQHMKNITVYANGNPRVNFRFLLKSPRSQKLDYILDDVAVKISAKTGYAIRNLFAMSGEKITDAAQIRDGESYVAAGVEKFKRAAYGMSEMSVQGDQLSATSQERPGRVRSRPLKPLKAPVKSQKETKEISGLKKPTKVQRKEALPPIAVAPVQKEPSDVVPDAPDIKTDLPIDQHSLPTHVSEFAANASDFIASESTETPDVVYSAPPGPLFVQDIEDEEELDDATANQTTTIISSRSAPDGMEFVLINPEDIPTVESTPEVPACEESQSRPSSKDAKVHFGDSPEAIKRPESNQEGEEADQTVAEQSDNEIKQENLISTNELTGEETIAEEQIAESRKEIEQIVHEEITSNTVTSETAVEEATTVTSAAPVPETPPTPKIESPLVENQHVKKWIDEEAVLAEYGIVECEEELSGAQILPPPSTASTHESTKELETAPLETGSDEQTEVEEEEAKEELQNTLIEDEDVEASVGEVSAELDDIKKEVEVVVDRTEQVSNDVDLLSNVIDQVQELETSAADEPESEMTTSVDVMKDIEYVSRTDSPSTEGPDDDEIDERTLNDIDGSVENPAPIMHVEVNPVFDSSEVNEDDEKRVDESDFVVEKAVGEDMLCRLSSSSTEGPDEDFSLIDDVSEDNILDETREAAPENQQQDFEMTPSERESEAVEVIIEDGPVQRPEIVEQKSNEDLPQNDDENAQESFEVLNFEEKSDFTAIADEENEELVIRENDIKTDTGAQEKIIDSEDKEIEEESKEAIISENIDVENADVIISEETIAEEETKEAFVSENIDSGENDTLISKEPIDAKTDEAVIIENNQVDEMDQDEAVDLDVISADPIVNESIADDICEADKSIVVENELEHVDNEIDGQENAESEIGKAVESSNIDVEESPEIEVEKIADEIQEEGTINRNTKDIVSNEEIDTTDEVVVSSEVEESDQVIVPHPAITESQTPIDIDSPDIVTEIDITQANNVEPQETTLEAVPEDSIIEDLIEKKNDDGEIVAEKEDDIQLASETIQSDVNSDILAEQDYSPEEETQEKELSVQESHQESHIQDEPEEEPASEKFDLISALISTEPETTQNEHQAEELKIQEPEETLSKENVQETVEDQTLLSGKTSHEDIIFEDTPSGPKIVDSEIPSISELEIPNEEEISHLLSSSSRITLPSEETLDRRTDELIADDLSCEQVTFASIDTNSEDFIMSQSESTTTGLSTIAESFESRMDSSLTPNQASVTDDQSMEVLEAVQIIAQDAKLPLFQPELDSAIGSTTEDPNIITDLKNLEVVDVSGRETSADSEITSENLAAETEVSQNEQKTENTEGPETVQEDVKIENLSKREEIVEQEQLGNDVNNQQNDLETDLEVASSTKISEESGKTPETQEIMLVEKIQKETMPESEAITHENDNIEETASTTEEPPLQEEEETLIAAKVDIVVEETIEDEAIVEPVQQFTTSTTEALISKLENVEQNTIILDERKSLAEEKIKVADKERVENDSEDQIQSDDQVVEDELRTEEPDQPLEINDAKISDSEVEEKVKHLVEETVEKVCTVAEPTQDGPPEAKEIEEKEIIAEKILETTVERDLDLDSLEGNASEIKDETVDEVSDLPLESERETSQAVTELLNQETETLEPQCGEEGLVIAHESKEEVLDAEKVIIAEKIDDCKEVPQEISDEQKITDEVDIIESQNITAINDAEESENIDQESLTKVFCDNDEKILDKSAQSQDFDDEKEGADEVMTEVLDTNPEEEAKVNQTAVVELPTEKMPELESSDHFVAEVSDGSEPSAVTLTESENDQTVIIAEPVREIAEPTIQPLQISNSEQDLSQDASDLSEINCFKNPMLTSSSIEDDLSSEAVANIIMESQRKMEENKVVEENDDEFFSVESTTIMDNNDSPDVEPEYEEPLSVPEETGYRKSSCQLQRVPVLVSSRSVDTGLQENLQDEDDLDDNNIMNTILEDAMTKSEPIVQVSATQESTETVEKTSTSVEIEKSANAATATSESIASITESESLEKVRSDKLVLEDEAPENIQTEFALEQQVTEEVKEEIAELRSSSFAPQEEEEKQEEEIVDEVKVDESADVDKFVGELVSEAVQKAKDEDQEKNEEVIEKTEDAESSEPTQVEETSAETKQKTVDEPVDEINEDNKETEPEISEEKAEEIPVLEEKIDPEDQIEIVSSSAEIDDRKVDDEKVEEGKVEEVGEEKDDGEDNLEEIKEIETKEFPEIETAISDVQESQDNSARKSPSPAPEEQKEASIPEPKEDSPEIPLTVIPDPEEKAAIEEAVKALSRPSEESEPAQVEDEEVDEILEETDLVKQAISSAVDAINSEPASSTEKEKVEQNDEEPKGEESYQGSDPKELEDAIIKESIKEGVAALNKTDDSGAAGLSETSAENVEVVEPSEVELPASEVEESKEQTIDEKKDETIITCALPTNHDFIPIARKIFITTRKTTQAAS